MELAPAVYAVTEHFSQSETFGLRMQIRRSAVNAATYIADGHGRLTDAENKKSLGIARGDINELQTQFELAQSLNLVDKETFERTLDLSVEVAKLRPSRRSQPGTPLTC